MELSTAIRAVLATLRRRPDDLLPMYILGVAIPAVVQALGFVGMGVLVGYYVVTSRAEQFRTELAAVDLDAPDPETEPEAFIEWLDTLVPVMEPLVTPGALLAVVIVGIISFVVLVVLTAAVTAGQLAACFARLQQQRGLVRGLAGAKRYWLRFLGVYLLELVLWVLVTVLAIAIVGLAFAISAILALFVGIFVALFWVASVIAIRAVFAFAPASIVVDDASIVGSLRGSVGFIRSEVMNAVSYYVISVGVLIAYGSVASTLTVLGAPSLATLASLLLIAPFLDLLKTILFGDYRGAVRPPAAPSSSVLAQVRGGLRRGVSEMTGFVRDAPGLHAIGAVFLGGGVVAGWVAADPFVGIVDASIVARTEAIVPPVDAIQIFANNWTVALAVAFAGLAAGVPAALILAFNGMLIGVLARLEVELIELIAFVIPHGILEIPAIIVSGALGFHLGIVGWRTWRSSSDRRALASALERAFWILIGLGVVLFAAGLIEGFISPYYFRLFF